MACTDALAKLETETDFYEALPLLLQQHGRDEVKASMQKLSLNSGQIKECLKRLEARQSHLVWLHTRTSAAGALIELTILVTDQSLNELMQYAWKKGDRQKPRDGEIVDSFLRQHCAPGCTVAAATATAQHLQVLARELPAVRKYVGDPLDLSSGGVPTYAALLGLPMLNASASSPDGSLSDFEARMRVGDAPTLRTPLGPDARGEEHCEAAICALGWARERLIAPPKAARYVTCALHALSVMLMASIVHAVALWMAVV